MLLSFSHLFLAVGWMDKHYHFLSWPLGKAPNWISLPGQLTNSGTAHLTAHTTGLFARQTLFLLKTNIIWHHSDRIIWIHGRVYSRRKLILSECRALYFRGLGHLHTAYCIYFGSLIKPAFKYQAPRASGRFITWSPKHLNSLASHHYHPYYFLPLMGTWMGILE